MSRPVPVQWVLGFFPGVIGGGVKLTTNLCIVLRSRMNGAKPSLHLYAFVCWTQLTLPLCFMSSLCHVSLTLILLT